MFDDSYSRILFAFTRHPLFYTDLLKCMMTWLSFRPTSAGLPKIIHTFHTSQPHFPPSFGPVQFAQQFLDDLALRVETRDIKASDMAGIGDGKE